MQSFLLCNPLKKNKGGSIFFHLLRILYINNGNLPLHTPLIMNHPSAQESHLSPVYPSLHVQTPLSSVQLVSTEPTVLQRHSEDIFKDNKNSLQHINNQTHLDSLGNHTIQLNKHHIYPH